MPLLLDTGVLYAAADRDDDWHTPVRYWLEDSSDLLVAPITVLPEVTYLVRTRLGGPAERRLLEAFVTGEIALEPLLDRDLKRAVELLEKYVEIGFVDASVVAVAERLGVTSIATTDRRHFAGIRPRHVPAFRLVPNPPG